MRQVDQSAALEALRKLESRLRATEDELSEMRLKVSTPCISLGYVELQMDPDTNCFVLCITSRLFDVIFLLPG